MSFGAEAHAVDVRRLTLRILSLSVINAEFCSHGSEKLRLLTTSFRKEHLLHFQDMYPKEREKVQPSSLQPTVFYSLL
jgi:hypothetical protein